MADRLTVAQHHDGTRMKMKRKSIFDAGSFLAFSIAVGIVSLTIQKPARADSLADQRCIRDDDIRLVEIRFATPEGDLPLSLIHI